MINHPSYCYALSVVNGEIEAPKYVKKQAELFLKICDDQNDKYTINKKTLKRIDIVTKNLVMAKGLKAGQDIYSSLAGYQWLIIVASLCVVYRKNQTKRRYSTVILEIARKEGKTFVVALLILLLFYIEPKFSRFYSVAPDGNIAKEVKDALETLLKVNVDMFEDKEFKILRDSITNQNRNTKYTPLNYSTQRMDSREPNVFIVDEVGALPNPYAIEAMRSGQVLLQNKLGFIISTKYPTVNNPFEDEIKDAKRILDDLKADDSVFALLFEPDNPDNWATDINVILQANPLAIDIPSIFEDLLKKRNNAIERESLRENFLTKHCNIIYQGAGTENYIDVSEVQKCKVAKIDWTGRKLYVGLDLAMSNDNCSVSVVSVDDDDNILCDVVAFIPEDRIDEKNQFEKIDYREFIRAGKCIACGERTVDYSVIEDYIFNIEDKYGGKIIAIGYDRYNCESTAQKCAKFYNTVEIRQHSDTLHPPTKLLYEKILNGEFEYEPNKLLEINFQNAKCTFDTNLNRYVTKKKSSGKVDMVVSTINAVYLLQQDVFLNNYDFVFQEA